jgi:hypothetical protein
MATSSVRLMGSPQYRECDFNASSSTLATHNRSPCDEWASGSC